MTAGLLFFLMPFEKLFPRVPFHFSIARLVVVTAIAVCTFAIAWGFNHTLYMPLVKALLSIQIFSVSQLPVPTWALLAGCIFLIDLMLYVFHVLSHKITPLWKLHAIHHADEHVDVATGILRHPFETVASLIFVLFFSVILGVPVVAVILYAGIGTIHNMFAHANISLPEKLDMVLRQLIVTPDMHRTHHSIDPKEGNSNFGQMFPFWDRAFGTYVDHPKTGEELLEMGLSAAEKPKSFSLVGLLLHPFMALFSKK